MSEKNTEISERITKIIDFLDVNPNSFAKKLGYNRTQTIYDIQNGKSAPSFDFLQRYQNSEYSALISIEWLLTGRGEMIKNKAAESKNKEVESKLIESDLIMRLIREKDAHIEELNKEIGRLESSLEFLRKKVSTPYYNVAEPEAKLKYEKHKPPKK